LVGTAQIAPRWKTCAGAANSHFGLSVGNMFIHEYFGPEAKVDVSIVYNDSSLSCKFDLVLYFSHLSIYFFIQLLRHFDVENQ